MLIESDYRFRGHSLSAGRPIAGVQLTYDHHSGLYVSASAIGQLTKDDFRLLGKQGNIGFARRLTPELTLDLGAIRSEFRPADAYARRRDYTEFYGGLSYRGTVARLSYSPNYYYPRTPTLYGEVEASVEPRDKWHLTGHLGTQIYLDGPYYPGASSSYFDWRLGLSRRLGALELHTAVSGGGPGKDYYGYQAHSKTALTAGASLSF